VDGLAELGLGVGVEISDQIKGEPAEQAVDGAAADAGELCQRLFAARDPAICSQIFGCCSAPEVSWVRHEMLQTVSGASQMYRQQTGRLWPEFPQKKHGNFLCFQLLS
jgi:hypothetical protein